MGASMKYQMLMPQGTLSLLTFVALVILALGTSDWGKYHILIALMEWSAVTPNCRFSSV